MRLRGRNLRAGDLNSNLIFDKALKLTTDPTFYADFATRTVSKYALSEFKIKPLICKYCTGEKKSGQLIIYPR